MTGRLCPKGQERAGGYKRARRFSIRRRCRRLQDGPRTGACFRDAAGGDLLPMAHSPPVARKARCAFKRGRSMTEVVFKALNRRNLTRRKFLGASATAAGAAFLSAGARAQSTRRRFEVSDPAMPAKVLTSSKTAMAAMLALPPTDPRNWYRNAFVHLLDCPHGNWWFLPWHRAYLVWFERICRQLSGDQNFALPYWDWTKNPQVPAA